MIPERFICNLERFALHLYTVIQSFRHKGLKLYYDKGDATKLQPHHVNKIRLILTRLDAAMNPSEMNIPGYDLHQLTGELKNFWSVKVNGNYRIIFRFESEHVYEVDYIDYH